VQFKLRVLSVVLFYSREMSQMQPGQQEMPIMQHILEVIRFISQNLQTTLIPTLGNLVTSRHSQRSSFSEFNILNLKYFPFYWQATYLIYFIEQFQCQLIHCIIVIANEDLFFAEIESFKLANALMTELRERGVLKLEYYFKGSKSLSC
jgi:hypothetical protein